VKELLNHIGLEQERIKMYNLSAAMANKFVDMAIEMTEEIRSLGPNPLRANYSAENPGS
jgi:F420-non-reducing hydrogenase iron-sulfur subunit